MDTQTVSPENSDERIVWYAITGTYAFYLLGALYLVAPVIGWLLAARLFWRLWLQSDATPPEDRLSVPIGIRVWVAAMLVMLLALVVGHLNQELGLAKLVKSSVGWAKGWALLAIFPLIGCLGIRPQLLYRAACVVAWQTMILLPLFIGAWLAGLPEVLYVSPLKIVGGPGPEFFAVRLYEIDPGTGLPRWRLFTPWAPALGFVANVYFLFALQEQDRRWRRRGIVGCFAMVVLSQSRLALVSLAVVSIAVWTVSRLARPSLYFAMAGVATAAGMSGVWLLERLERFWQAFRAARADSTRVREALGRIAVDRWWSEAPVWGHGIVERGPHLVEYMPIGSHHSWYGLLFVKGLVGLLALAVPLAWSALELTVKAQHSRVARVGLAMVLLLFLYTFGENLEVLAYLFWPALVALGLAHRAPLLPRVASRRPAPPLRISHQPS